MHLVKGNYAKIHWETSSKWQPRKSCVVAKWKRCKWTWETKLVLHFTPILILLSIILFWHIVNPTCYMHIIGPKLTGNINRWYVEGKSFSHRLLQWKTFLFLIKEHLLFRQPDILSIKVLAKGFYRQSKKLHTFKLDSWFVLWYSLKCYMSEQLLNIMLVYMLTK